MSRKPWLYLIFVLALAALTLSCGLLPERRAAIPTPTFTRTPRPTFTPTPLATPTFTPTFTPTPEPFTPTPTPSPTPPVPQIAIVSAARANVRQGPGAVYPLIGQVPGGTQFEIRARNERGDWIKVCCVRGREGWVSTSLLSIPGEIAMINVTTDIPPTPTPRPPTPTPVPIPTPTPAPAWPYVYVQGSMRQAPNCGAVWFRVRVVDGAGNPINGVVVELNWFDNWAYMSTGIDIPGIREPPGEVGFTPLGPELYHPPQPFEFRIRLVADNTPNVRIGLTKSPPPGLQNLSDTVVITFEDCNKAGQFDNITFRKVR
ncbi:MAG: SH3 domain-containing protein [Anaerolineae bacterium]|nr:SH3 domain-containing protein [Anaerolineae bacterium]MDW8102153.1 SH3 domain-containing protein [Anaerolineae bacterium]